MAEAAGAVRYVEFVLMPHEVFEAFCAAGDGSALEAIVGAGGPAASEPPAEVPVKEGEQRSLHFSSQAAQPTESGSQTGGWVGTRAAGLACAGAGLPSSRRVPERHRRRPALLLKPAHPPPPLPCADSVCGGAAKAPEGGEVTSAAAARAPTPSVATGPLSHTPSNQPQPSGAAPASTISGEPLGSRR